ncbi:hypothetical protein D3C87_1578400 [compost metagenome]
MLSPVPPPEKAVFPPHETSQLSFALNLSPPSFNAVFPRLQMCPLKVDFTIGVEESQPPGVLSPIIPTVAYDFAAEAS